MGAGVGTGHGAGAAAQQPTVVLAGSQARCALTRAHRLAGPAAGTTIAASDRIAKPSADAPLYRKGQVVLPTTARVAAAAAKAAAAQRRPAAGIVVPATPAVNAWQKPLQAALQPVAAGPAGEAEQQQQQLPRPPPPPPKQPQQPEPQSAIGAAADTPEPVQAIAPARSDTPLLALGSSGYGSSELAGWNPIGGSAFGLASGPGMALAAASADSSRATTPALVGSSDMGSLAAAPADVLVYPFPASGSSLHGSLSAAAAGPGQPWEQRSGSLGGTASGLGPTGDESAFLSQLMQGAWGGG